MFDMPTLVEHFHYLGLFLLLVLGGAGFPFPEGITLMLCGFLISRGTIRPLYALIVVFLGMLTGDLAIYLIGRKYGRAVVSHRRFRKLMTPQRLSALETTFHRRKVLFIILGRYLGSTVFLVAGIARISYLKFLGLDVVSSALSIGLLVGAGYLGGHSIQVLTRDVTRIEHAGIVLGVVSLAVYLVFRFFKARRDRTRAA